MSILDTLRKYFELKGYTNYDTNLYVNDPYYVVLTDKYAAAYKKKSPTAKLKITSLRDLSDAQVERLVTPLYMNYTDRTDRIEEIRDYLVNKIP